MQVVGETAEPASFTAEMPDIDVIVVAEEQMLADVAQTVRTATGGGTIAIVILFNSNEYSASLLRGLSLCGWSIVPLDVSTVRIQTAIVAAAQGFVFRRVYWEEPTCLWMPRRALREEKPVF